MNDREEDCGDTGVSVMWLMELEQSTAQKGNSISVHISTYTHELCVTPDTFQHFSNVQTAHVVRLCLYVSTSAANLTWFFPNKHFGMHMFFEDTQKEGRL